MRSKSEALAAAGVSLGLLYVAWKCYDAFLHHGDPANYRDGYFAFTVIFLFLAIAVLYYAEESWRRSR